MEYERWRCKNKSRPSESFLGLLSQAGALAFGLRFSTHRRFSFAGVAQYFSLIGGLELLMEIAEL